MNEVILAPWVWKTDSLDVPGQHWGAPPRCTLLRDLRSLPQCADRGTQFPMRGVFQWTEPGPPPRGTGIMLADDLKGSMGRRKPELQRELGLGEGIIADNFGDVLIEVITRYGDPTGLTTWKPLRGTRRGLKLTLGGLTLRYSVAADHPVLQASVAIFQADYRRNKAEGYPLEILQRWTGSTMLDLWGSMSDELASQLLPPEYMTDGWRIPKTVINESFNGDDSDILGIDLSWTQVTGGWKNDNNRCLMAASNALQAARAESALSSANHYSQAIAVSRVGSTPHAGNAMRFHASAETYLAFRSRKAATATYTIFKIITGTPTELKRTNATAPGDGPTLKGQVDGSDDIEGFEDDVSKVTVNDNSVTGNLYTGLSGVSSTANDVLQDDFEGGDLVVGRIMGALAGQGGLAGPGGIAGHRGGIAG